MQRSDLKREIDQAMNEHPDERQRAKGKPHHLLAGQGQWVLPQVENYANDPAANQYRPKKEPERSLFEDGLQIILMSITQDAVECAPVLLLEQGKDN